MKRIVLLLGAAFICIGFLLWYLPPSAGLQWVIALWISWVVTGFVVYRRRPISLPVAGIQAAMLVYILLPATVAAARGYASIAGFSYSRGVVPAIQMSLLAQMGMAVGFLLVEAPRPPQSIRKLTGTLDAVRIRRAALVSMVIGVLGLLAFVAVSGANLGQFFAIAGSSSYGSLYQSAAGDKIGYFVALQLVAGIALILLVLYLVTGGAGKSLTLLLLLVVIVFLTASGQRSRVAVPSIAAALVAVKCLPRYRGSGRVLAIVGVLSVLVFSAAIGVAREGQQYRNFSPTYLLSTQFGSGSDLFSPLAGLMQYVPASSPYLLGRSYAETVVFPIPRVFWPGKPQGSIANLTQHVASSAGVAFPEYGEMYANFGPVGVLVGSVIFAAMIQLIWRWFANSNSHKSSILAAVLTATMLQLFTRGSLAVVVSTFGALILASIYLARPRSRVLETVPSCLDIAPLRHPGESSSERPPIGSLMARKIGP